MTDTGRDLYRALLADPWDDTLRLVLADRLQEEGEEDRAELIRVQVELAKWSCNFKQTEEQPGWFHDCGTDERGYWMCQPLRMRSDELVTAHPEWRSIPCPECESKGKEPGLWGWRQCPACDGTGDLAKRNDTHDEPGRGSGIVPRPGSWQKGYWLPHCTLRELFNTAGRKRLPVPTPWARALARSVPVASLGLVGAKPWPNPPGRALWLCRGSDGLRHFRYTHPNAILDEWLFIVLEGDQPSRRTKTWKVFPTQAAALDALSAAAARWLVREVWGKGHESPQEFTV